MSRVNLFANSSWMKFPKDLVLIWSVQECILFAYLSDMDEHFHRDPNTYAPYPLEKGQGWFKCPIEYVEQDLGWSNQLANRWMRALRERSVLETARGSVIGAPRFLRLDYEEVLRQLASIDSGVTDR